MDAPFVKTAAGLAEIAQRSDKLSRPLRNVLVCVDGKRDRAALLALGGSIGAPDDAVDQLLQLGLIALAEGAAAPAAVAPLTGMPQPSAAFASAVAPVATPAPAVPVPDAGTSPAKRCEMVADLVGTHLGLIRARGIQQRLQNCRSEADFQALLPEVQDALASRLGEAQARKLLREQLTAA